MIRAHDPLRTRRERFAAGIAAATTVIAGALLTIPIANAATAPVAAPASAAATSTAHQWLTGYWHNFDNGSVTMKVSEIPKAYNLVAIAFADNLATTPGGITFDVASAELGGYTAAQFKADVAAIRAEGRKVVLSVGGERGNVIVSNATEAKNFADTAYALMQEWGFDGIDVDLEHGINAQYMSDALHQLRAKAGAGFVLTMAPQTIDYQATTMPYYQLTLKVKDILTIVNTQYYNSGTMMGADQKVYSQGTVDFLTALAAIQLDMGLRPDQVGIGVPAVQKAAGGGYQPMANVVKAVDCLETGANCGTFTPATPYGPIGGVMTWSINWDKTGGWAVANTVGARLGSGSGTPTPDPDPTPTPDPTPMPTPTPTPDPTPDPGTCGAPAWSSSAVYNGGAKVSYKGVEYTAKWWTQGDTPDSNAVWSRVSDCAPGTDPGTGPGTDPGTGPGTDPGTCAAAWSASAAYASGATVTYQGAQYRAKWWTQGEAPGSQAWGAWEALGACS
ncbi:carbohydrate-binding protein [Microbacterium sp. NPDC057659]|uniref:carbohydrate-binding protein n=1 Tax=Microbacterium sp. NPDC057659 TaxID=3346198 RepID=UPI00366B0C4F